MKLFFNCSLLLIGMLLSFNTAQAQLQQTTDSMQQLAKDRYEQHHNVVVADFKSTITPTANNLQLWESVLAGFSLQERRGVPNVGLSNSSSNNPHVNKPIMTLKGVRNVGIPAYQAVKDIVRTIKQGLGLPVGLKD